MIFVQLTDGLGNQLFQYAAGRALALRCATALKLDARLYRRNQTDAHSPPRCYGLGAFNIAAEVANAIDAKAIDRATQAGVVPAVRRLMGGGLRHHREILGDFEPRFLDLRDNTVLTGYFQSERYFADRLPAIRRELTFREQASYETGVLLERIRTNPHSVALHVRRGDYLHLPDFEVLPVSYYRAAMEYLSSRLGAAPKVFVCSDDPGWCRSQLELPVPFEVVEAPTRMPHDAIRLMGACRHVVIANSSFSWWGAWLNPHPDKIVVAPRRWFSWLSDGDKPDLVPRQWVRV